MEFITFPSSAGNCVIYARKWRAKGEYADNPKGVVQIVHGMAEHTGRYDDIAQYLNGLGYVVYAGDHAGHGLSINDAGAKGFFADENGWDRLIDDIRSLAQIAQNDYPNAKRILYGHSMGSFLARTYAARHKEDFDAYIFSGTAGKNPALPIARLIAKQQIKKHGARGRSRLLNKLAFGAYNKRIDSPASINSWLSTDEAVVKRYDEDKLCGFSFTCSAYRDLFCGLSEIGRKQWARDVPNVPIYIFAGKDDPVGNYGKGVIEVCNRLRKAGKERVALQLYAGGRHEMHNEKNREAVYRGVAAFLRSV